MSKPFCNRYGKLTNLNDIKCSIGNFYKIFKVEFSMYCFKFKRNTQKQMYSFGLKDVFEKLMFLKSVKDAVF